jgi:hypothetical protein
MVRDNLYETSMIPQAHAQKKIIMDVPSGL